MLWPEIGATQYHGLPDKGRAINVWDLEPLDLLLNGLAPGCYQPSPEVLIVLKVKVPSKHISYRVATIKATFYFNIKLKVIGHK